MGTYGETVRRTSPSAATFRPVPPSGDQPSFTCDQCVAPSVAVIFVGTGPSALSLEFCAHHLAQHTEKLADRKHEVRFHR